MVCEVYCIITAMDSISTVVSTVGTLPHRGGSDIHCKADLCIIIVWMVLLSLAGAYGLASSMM